MALEGGCLCGAVRYRIEGEAGRTTHCHCLHCRRSSGAPFLTWLVVTSKVFSWTAGEPARFASRPGVTREFCSRCGTPLTYRNDEDPEEVDVTAGSLDSPEGLAPQDHIWCERKLPWIHLDDGLPHHRFARGT